MQSKLRRPTSRPVSAGTTPIERDAMNFDFRLVTLLLVMITRPDLLKEYLEDGKEKDACKVPSALCDPDKWKTLRTLFDPPMLAEMLYLFELPQTLACAQHMLQVFQTMVNLNEYDWDGCPNSAFVRAIVEYAGQQTAELNPAGVAVDPGERK